MNWEYLREKYGFDIIVLLSRDKSITTAFLSFYRTCTYEYSVLFRVLCPDFVATELYDANKFNWINTEVIRVIIIC